MYDPARPRSRVFIPAIVSGLLLYASFFPLNLGFLAWIALTPFVSLVRANARPRRIYLAAFVGGLFCYIPAIQWIRVAHPAMYGAWIFLGIVCALFLVLTLALIRKLDRVGLPIWLAAPLGFIAVEYLRSHFPTGYTWMELVGARHPIGFGWYMIGHTQHEFVTLSQIADVTGVYGLTFIVVAVNAALWQSYEQIFSSRPGEPAIAKQRPPSWRPALVAFGLLIIGICYGMVRLNHEPFADGPRVALIQGNLPQDVKNLKGDEMVGHFTRLADQAVRALPGEQPPNLVIWPETSLALGWWDLGPNVAIDDVSTEFRREFNLSRTDMKELAYRWPVHMLYGLSSFQWEVDHRPWRYNTALLVDSFGKPVARYDKIHLVPLGEYVPFPETFPFLQKFTPHDAEYSCKPGQQWTRFPLTIGERTFHFACVICYEDTDASLSRQYVRPNQPGVDFFVNISNDGWFDGTAEHEQHLAICRFRAIETRRSFVRAVNMGISAIIDPDGRVVALPGETWAKSKKVEGIVRGAVPIDARSTIYARFGDWLPLLAWLTIAGAIISGFVRRRPV